METSTQTQTINAGLLTGFGVLVAGLVPAFNANFWYGVADFVLLLATALVYHSFFNE